MNRRGFTHLVVLTVIAVIAISMIGVMAYYRMLANDEAANTNTQYACTLEAKLCPDGSYVGRTGPHCEFAACPGSAAVNDNTNTDTTAVTEEYPIGKLITDFQLGNLNVGTYHTVGYIVRTSADAVHVGEATDATDTVPMTTATPMEYATGLQSVIEFRITDATGDPELIKVTQL